jgi:hypothetical protein
MKDLFVRLLLSLTSQGDITEAYMSKGGNFSSVAIETKDGIYEVSIMKKDEEKVNG